MTKAERMFLHALTKEYGHEAVLYAMLLPPNGMPPIVMPAAATPASPKLKRNANPNALKLTTTAIDRIGVLRKQGHTLSEIANQLRISIATASTGAKLAQTRTENESTPTKE